MNKTELGEKIATKFNLTKKTGEEIVEYTAATIIETLKAGGEVTITGFGTFSARERKGRIGINPRTKEKIQVNPVKVAKFKAGKVLKDTLKGKI